MLLRLFDQYGWAIEGRFFGMVGFLQRHHAEIAGVGLIMHPDRMRVVEYTDGAFIFQ